MKLENLEYNWLGISSRVEEGLRSKYVDFILDFLNNKKILFKDFSYSQVNFVFLTEKEMKDINFKYREKETATDVLSFVTEATEKKEGFMGEVLFCEKIIEQKSVANEISFEEQFFYLLAHGILHLLGYEHECGGEKEEEMMNLQEAIYNEYFC